jgi:hypothetical protein
MVVQSGIIDCVTGEIIETKGPGGTATISLKSNELNNNSHDYLTLRYRTFNFSSSLPMMAGIDRFLTEDIREKVRQELKVLYKGYSAYIAERTKKRIDAEIANIERIKSQCLTIFEEGSYDYNYVGDLFDDEIRDYEE